MDGVPERIFVPLRDADISKDKVFTNDIEYIRADLYADLLRAADALADAVGLFKYGEIPLELFVAREVYNKAKEKTK